MDLYNELFPEDCGYGEEKIASRSMDYLGIRFDERVEKLAGVKDWATRGLAKARELGAKGWEKTKDYHRSIKSDFEAARTGKGPVEKVRGKGKHKGETRYTPTTYGAGARTAYGLQAAAKTLPHAGILGGVGYGGKKVYDKYGK